MRLLALLFALAVSACAQYNGLGASTVTCLDKDGDGYGVGPTCTGRDADDNDPAVYTAAQATTKWGTMAAFLAHLGYTPLRTWYISAAGNDTTCNANPRNISFPCATWANIQGSIQPGDMVLWRGGTYTERINALYAAGGTSSNPIVYMAYPGESVIINNTTDINLCAAGLNPQNRDYITVDGFILSGDISTGSEAVNLCYNDHVTLRYNEAKNHGRGFFGSFMSNTTVEYNVSHDTNGGGNPSHTLYFGARETPMSGVVIRSNIFWNPGRSCVQLNGRFSNSTIDGNWCYGFDSTAGISLEMGVNHSTVRNNVVWNGQAKPFVMFDYPEQTACGTDNILPYDQNYNVIENNTFVVPKYNLNGTVNGGMPNIEIAIDGEYGKTFDLGHNTFRNNTLINYSGYVPVSIHTRSTDCAGSYLANGYQDPNSIAATLTWQNNLVYQLTSTGKMMWLYNIQNTAGTPPGVPAPINMLYDWAQWNGYNATTSANITAPPQFTAYSDAWYTIALAGNFDFRPTAASPVLNAGTASSATLDALGYQRTLTPSIGAYQYASGGTALAVNRWTQAITRGTPIPSVGWEKAVYSRAGKKTTYLGTYHMNSTEPNNALFGFDYEQNRWDLLNVNGLFHEETMPESGHPVGHWWYDSTRKVIGSICCSSGSNQYENLFHTWQFDVAGQTARDVHSSPRPNFANDYQGTSTYDSIHDVVVMLNSSGAMYSLNPSTNTWAGLSPSGTCPGATANTSSTFDSANGKVYFFGGRGVSATNALYSYTYAAGAGVCTLLTPSGTAPAAREKAGFDYDSLNNVIIMAGGENNSGGILNDTWRYDPVANAWAQLTPSANFPVSTSATWERFSYDADHNVFVSIISGNGGYADGTYGENSSQTWLYRYAGGGPSLGSLSNVVSPSAGSRNRNLSGWAKRPALATSGSTLYLAHEEYPTPFNSTQQWPHIYADSYAPWTNLGTYDSISPDNGSVTQAYDTSMAVIGGAPWVSYYSGTPGDPRIYAKRGSGSTWTGGAIGLVNNTAGVYQSRSSLAGVGTVPYIAFLENDKSASVFGQNVWVYLKHWNGSAWVLDGTALNRDGSGTYTIATSVSTASDGTNLYVAFTEYTTNNYSTDTNPKVYVSKWNGSSLVTVGGALNQTAGTYASDATITFMGGQPYVAWVERTVAGTATLYVKTTANGSTWTLVGSGALNRTAGSWAYRPALANDGTALYLAHVEQSAIGQKPQAYVSKFAAGAWTYLGSSLNASANGSAQGVALAVVSGKPTVAWGEVNTGAYRNVYVSQWSGTDWGPITTAVGSCDINADGSTNVLDVQAAVNQALGTAPCGSADLIGNGACSVIDVQRVIIAALGGSCRTGQ